MTLHKFITKTKYYLSSPERFCWWVSKTAKFHCGKFSLKMFFVLYHFRRYKVQQNKVVFRTWAATGFGDNCKYIALELIERGGFEVVWLNRMKEYANMTDFPKGIKVVEYPSSAAMYELATSKFWVFSMRTYIHPPKQAGQIYIQAWHGNFNYKKVEGGMLIHTDAHVRSMNPDKIKLEDEHLQKLKYDSSIADYFVSGSEEENDVFRREFFYNGKILETGLPRCDVLYDNKARSRFRKKLGFAEEEKFVLYAPTFRDEHDMSSYNLDYESVRAAFSKLYGGARVTILLRLHPNLYKHFDELSIPASVKNESLYPDMQELLCAVDALITDYSSSTFDFVLTKRPIFLYVPDLEHYAFEERGLDHMPCEFPFDWDKTNAGLCRKIEQFDEAAYRERIEVFLKDNRFFGNGHASAAIADVIEQEMH